MPILKSAIKKLKADSRRERENSRLKNAYKTALKTARAKKSKSAVSLAFSRLDRAAKKKVIHKNTASRLKARLTKLLKK